MRLKRDVARVHMQSEIFFLMQARARVLVHMHPLLALEETRALYWIGKSEITCMAG